MSTNVQINGVSFLSIKEAASRFSYTRDYVARLAREEKITAIRVGRKWLVDPSSIEKFSQTAELEHRARQNQLSLERKRERLVKEALEASRLSLIKKKQSHHPRSLSLALCACLVVLFVGYGFHVSPVRTIPTTYQLARTPTTPEAGRLAVVPSSELQVLPVTVSFMERPVFEDSFEVREFTSSTTGIVLLPSTGGFSDAESVKKAFSDDVVVTMSEDGVGTVRLKDDMLADGQSVEMPFVTVPIQQSAGEEVRSVTP